MLSILGLVAVAAVDAGSPLITDWAQPPMYTYNSLVTCDQPDAGITVTVFREPEWSSLGDECDFSPLTCSTAAARDEVLRLVRTRSVRFPEPVATAQPDPDGWLKLPVRNDDTLLVECGDLVQVVPAWPLMSLPITLTRDVREATELPADIARVVVVNPFTREVRNVTREEFAKLPQRVTERAWAAAQYTSNEWSEPVQRLYAGQQFALPGPPTVRLGWVGPWGFDGGTPVTVTVEAPDLTPSNLGIVIRPPESNRAVAGVYTHANGARFGLRPGRWAITVKMNGAMPVSGEFTVTDQPRNLIVPLERGCAGTVIDERGRPVERACVSYEEAGHCRGWSDHEGRFALEFPSELRWVRATHPYVGSSARVPFKFGVPITLKLRAQNKVVLHVPPVNGRVARGWLAVDPAYVAPGFESAQPPTYPAFEGDITLTNLAAGPHHVVLSVPGYVQQTLEVRARTKGTVSIKVPPWQPATAESVAE